MKDFQQNVSLADYTTFKIGGPARYFFVAKTKEDLREAVNIAKEQGLPYFILGGGSNVLVSDEGFEGLVIKIKNQKSKIKNAHCSHTANQNSKIIEADAGVELKKLVELSAEEGLTGLEWAAGIPQATLGGAIKVNASAFNHSMQDIVKDVEVFDGVILSALLGLKKKDKKEVQKQIDYVLRYRETNHPMEFPSAGCTFKNPPTIPAGRLIEQCGLKGRTIGKAQISEKHANFIINLGGAKAEDIRQLIKLAKEKVKEKFGINLKEEIQYVGFK